MDLKALNAKFVNANTLSAPRNSTKIRNIIIAYQSFMAELSKVAPQLTKSPGFDGLNSYATTLIVNLEMTCATANCGSGDVAYENAWTNNILNDAKNNLSARLAAFLTPIVEFAKNSGEGNKGVLMVEERKTQINQLLKVTNPLSDTFKKLQEEKYYYDSVSNLLSMGGFLELEGLLSKEVYDKFNPPAPPVTLTVATPQGVNVNITASQSASVVSSPAKPQEVVTVSNQVLDSQQKPISKADIPTTESGKPQTIQAMDVATGNVVEIVTDKSNSPVSKPAMVENTKTGAQTVQNLAVNEKGQPIATIVKDSKGAVQTMTDPVTQKEMPLVNTASMPEIVRQAVNNPVARVETIDNQNHAKKETLPPEEQDITKPLVALAIGLTLAGIGYAITK